MPEGFSGRPADGRTSPSYGCSPHRRASATSSSRTAGGKRGTARDVRSNRPAPCAGFIRRHTRAPSLRDTYIQVKRALSGRKRVLAGLGKARGTSAPSVIDPPSPPAASWAPGRRLSSIPCSSDMNHSLVPPKRGRSYDGDAATRTRARSRASPIAESHPTVTPESEESA